MALRNIELLTERIPTIEAALERAREIHGDLGFRSQPGQQGESA